MSKPNIQLPNKLVRVKMLNRNKLEISMKVCVGRFWPSLFLVAGAGALIEIFAKSGPNPTSQCHD